jgi:hypothetical protein
LCRGGTEDSQHEENSTEEAESDGGRFLDRRFISWMLRVMIESTL